MRKIFLGLTSVLFLSGFIVWGAFAEPQRISAQQSCTIGGRQLTSSDGQMICDCTATQNNNCRCTVSGECPKKPAEEAELMFEGGGVN